MFRQWLCLADFALVFVSLCRIGVAILHGNNRPDANGKGGVRCFEPNEIQFVRCIDTIGRQCNRQTRGTAITSGRTRAGIVRFPSHNTIIIMKHNRRIAREDDGDTPFIVDEASGKRGYKWLQAKRPELARIHPFTCLPAAATTRTAMHEQCNLFVPAYRLISSAHMVSSCSLRLC